ncbi:hypothetical protein LBMAG42_32580 [Deltaproteobacteria bacterium]|nr:hypothetical protein LBMAG42_32580 [Deltaproteobacteria bacterium]
MQRLAGELARGKRALQESESYLEKANNNVTSHERLVLHFENEERNAGPGSPLGPSELQRRIDRKFNVRLLSLPAAPICAVFGGWLGWEWSSGAWSLLAAPVAFVVGGAFALVGFVVLCDDAKEKSALETIHRATAVRLSLEENRASATHWRTEVATYTENVELWQTELRTIEAEIARNRAIVRGG